MIKNIIGTKKHGGKNDWDNDGISNRKDCQPRNTMRQDRYKKQRVALGTNIVGGKFTNTIANSASLRNDAINLMRRDPIGRGGYEMSMAHMNCDDGGMSRSDLNLVAKEYSRLKKKFPSMKQGEDRFIAKHFP